MTTRESLEEKFGQAQQALIDKFKLLMDDAADKVISDFYTDVAQYASTDAHTNYHNYLRDEFKASLIEEITTKYGLYSWAHSIRMIICPKCKSNDLAVQRRPDGDAVCGECHWMGPYKECFAVSSPTTRDSLAELYVKGIKKTLTSSTEDFLSIVATENFKSGWEALAKMIRDLKMSHGEACISRLGHRESCTCYVATIGKLVREK